MRWLIVVGSIVVIAIAVLVLRELGGDDGAVASGAQTGSAMAASAKPATPSVATGPAAPSAPAREAPALVDEGIAKGTRKAKQGVSVWGLVGVFDETPEAYEVTESAGYVAVNVSGGRSGLYSSVLPPAGKKTTIRGKVVDRGGGGVAGAVVLIDTEFRMMSDSFLADGGGTSGADGQFVAEMVEPEKPVLAMAMHPRVGWSEPTPVGSGPVVLTVRAGRLEGVARFNGKGASYNIVVGMSGGTLHIPIETHADGTFVIAPLAPGTYQLAYGRAQAQGGNSSRTETREIVIEDGKTTRVELDQRAGTMIVATAQIPDGMEPDTMSAALFSGKAVPKDATEANARIRAEKAPGHMIGGADLAPVIQFHDVVPGDYVVCMYPFDKTLFGCAAAKVVDGEATKHLEIALVATKP